MYRLDRHSKEAKTMAAVQAWLADYVGGNPNIVQMLLIDRAAFTTLRIILKERKLLERGEDAMTVHDDNYYTAWTRTLLKIFKQLQPPQADEASAPELSNILNEVRGTTPPGG
jgi:hypothetical protein